MKSMTDNGKAKLIGLFFGAALLLNFPMLQIFGKDQTVLGYPLLYLYIFVVWLLVIIMTYRLIRKNR